MSLTYLARLGCLYFGQFYFCDLFDVKNDFLLRGVAKNEDLLVIDIQDLFNMNEIEYEDIIELEKMK